MKAWRIVPVVLLAMMVSCDEQKLYDHFQHTSLSGWARNDTLTFLLPAVKEKGTYLIDLGLRINSAYPFTGITLVVEQYVYPHASTTLLPTAFSRDTLNCKLFDDNGKPKKEGINLFQYNYHVKQFNLSPNDSIKVQVRHVMKRESPEGIADVGIKLLKE